MEIQEQEIKYKPRTSIFFSKKVHEWKYERRNQFDQMINCYLITDKNNQA
jgi:hypothetical protein